MVVDDDDGYRELMVIALQAYCGVQRVDAFAGGAQALAALRAMPAAAWPQLLLLDLHMPGQDGLALLQALRALGARGQAVVISNAALPHERAACEAAGARVVQKPARFEELVAALQDLMTSTTRSLHVDPHRPGR